MNEKLRQTFLGLIWPGPIAGPLPVNLFRLLAPILVLSLRPLLAALLMGFIASILSIIYFRLLRFKPGEKFAEGLLERLPTRFYQQIKTKGPIILFASSVIFGVFTYAVFLRLLRCRETTSEALLIVSSFVNSFIWAGLFWGSIVEVLRRVPTFAF